MSNSTYPLEGSATKAKFRVYDGNGRTLIGELVMRRSTLNPDHLVLEYDALDGRVLQRVVEFAGVEGRLAYVFHGKKGV